MSYKRFYRVRIAEEKVWIDWYQQTGRYGAPSEWDGGDVELMTGIHKDGQDTETRLMMYPPNFDYGHGTQNSEWQPSVEGAFDAAKHISNKKRLSTISVLNTIATHDKLVRESEIHELQK